MPTTRRPVSPPPKLPKAPMPRRPGRPGRPVAAAGLRGSARLSADSGGQAPIQRERLLDAAIALFAERGVAATHFKAIAERAGVTPALVHYYFRDRDGLLDAVADERLGPLVERVFSLDTGRPAPPDEPAMLLGEIAERLVVAASEHAWFPALWLREIVQGEGQLRERVMQRVGLRRVGAVAAALAGARANAKLASALAPPLLMVSVIGLALLPLATTHLWRRLPGAEAVDADAMIRHVRALLAHGVSGAAPLPRSSD